MPHLPSRPPRPQDPNFPHLPTEPPAPRPWHSHSPTTNPAWPPHPAPKATAAEVVAGAVKTLDPNVQPPDHAVEERHQAELALYSKLVPTTSAVPRNPGRTLGGGGLRATGSVAAQKPRSVPPPTQLVAPQPLSRPMASRMRNLSSDASKPQLARRVAKPNRTPSATPPPPASETTSGSDPVPVALVEPLTMDTPTAVPPNARNAGVDNPIVTPSPRQVRAENEDAYLQSIRSIYGNVDRETIRPVSRNEGSASTTGARKSGEGPTPPRPPTQPSRRLDEAFKSPSPPPASRYDGRRSPSAVPSRKDQIGALRRSSALSPPPGLPATQRKGSGRDGALTPVKNGRKSSIQDAPTGVPPGFEARTSTVNRGTFLGRGKPDGEGPSVSKNGEREREPAPARPQNARAHAFREAINTRRHSSSPRPASSRHTSGVDPNVDLPQKSSGIRTSTAREGSRLQNDDKEISRPVSFPAKHSSSTLNGSLSPECGRSRRKSDLVTANVKRDEKIMQRRLERPTGLPATLASAESKPKTQTEGPPPNTNRTDSTTNGSIVGDRHVEKKINTRPNNGQLKSLTVSKHEYIFSGTATDGPTEILSPKVVSYPDREQNELSIGKSGLEAQRMNGWSDGANGVSDGHAEAFVNDLLEHEDDDFVPVASTPTSSRPVTTGLSGGPSMIDLMRQLHANDAMSSVLSNPERQEDVLPPLPNSEEDVRFETMLRSMGWTPPDEDETPKNHQSNGTALPTRESSSRGLRGGVSDLGLRSGLRNVENGKTQSPYYSHFQ